MVERPELFKGAAEYYAKYRPEYPREFFDLVRNYFKLDGKGRLLDLGCGTGKVAIPLADDFEEVIGLDPEQEMLDAAREGAERAGIKNIKWMFGKAEDVNKDFGMFRLTTMGASFHWMQQTEVLQKIYDHTDKNGGVAIVSEAAHVWKYDKGEEEWKKTYKNLVRKYLGEERRAGNSLYQLPEDFEDAIDHSPFGSHEVLLHNYTRSWTPETIIGFLHSTSFASKKLFGSRSAEFESELREVLRKIAPSGNFSERVSLETLVALK